MQYKTAAESPATQKVEEADKKPYSKRRAP
jgi:hypothetical protein